MAENNEFSNESHKTAFLRRLAHLREQLQVVSSMVDRASGFPEAAGRIDVQVAEFFAEYIAWELEHPEIMMKALVANETLQDGSSHQAEKTGVTVERGEGRRRYHYHVDHELSGVATLLERTKQRCGQSSEKATVQEISWEEMTFSDGYFRVGRRPVFPAGFNMVSRSMVDIAQHPDWGEKDASLHRKFLMDMRRIGVGIIDVGIPVISLILPGGSIDTGGIGEKVDEILSYQELGFKVDVLFSWSGDKSILEELWPGITEHVGHSIGFDIDHPGVRAMVERVFAELMPSLSNLPAIASWDMANEPFFDIEMWSPYTLRNYHRWLSDRYPQVQDLNTRWGAAYESIQAVPLPHGERSEKCSPGEWYDRVTFHNLRVTRFFEFVHHQIRRYVPHAVIHLKAQDNSSLGPRPEAVTEGIDREKLTPFVDMQGLDTRPLPVTEPRMAAGYRDSTGILGYDAAPYGFHWLGQSFLYDYLTSLAPGIPIVDFEYHAFSINAIRIPDIRQTHAQAALWMAHLHGLVGNMAWYWHRRYGPNPFPMNYFMMWLYGSISTQPLVAAEYFQAMLELNTFSEEIEALATVPERPIRLLVSKPSYIHNQAHINALHRAYEGVCFHGLRVGFVTEHILSRENIPADCRILIIPDVEYIGADALGRLRSAAEHGVHLLRFGRVEPRFDKHGVSHPPGLVRFASELPEIDYASASDLSRRLESHLSSCTSNLPIRVTREGSGNAFGVMHRQTVLRGRRIVLLVNLAATPVVAQLTTPAGDAVAGYDMVHDEAISGSAVPLAFQAVRLVEIDD